MCGRAVFSQGINIKEGLQHFFLISHLKITIYFLAGDA